MEPRLLLSPGDLDSTFGSGGKVVTSFGTGAPAEATNLAVLANGKVVVVGFAENGSSRQSDFAVARYNPDGSLDATFGAGGQVVTDLGGRGLADVAEAVIVQPDGKLLVVGHTQDPVALESDFALVRYNPDGSLDPTFGVGGVVTTDFGTAGATHSDAAYAVALLPNGKILAAGYSQNTLTFNSDFALARYNPDGTLDATFGTGGKVVTDLRPGENLFDAATALIVQPDGKILLAGGAQDPETWEADFALVRYLADGKLDTAFGTGGKVITNFHASENLLDVPTGLALQADGKILVCGFTQDSTTFEFDFALARYTTSGKLDSTFGKGGKVVTDFLGGDNLSDIAAALAVQADGKILVAGSSQDAQSLAADFALFRYNTNGTLDATFGKGGQVATNFGSAGNKDDVARAIALLPDGKVVLAGFATHATTQTTEFALARYVAGGSSATSITLEFAVESITIGEAGKTVKIDVVRSGDLTKQVTVAYATGGGTATAGKDYTKASGTLTFKKNETRKTISIKITDDKDDEGPEDFLVTLSKPSSGTSLGTKTSARVTITDNDPPPPPPKLNSVAATRGSTGVTSLVLTFSAALDPTTAGSLAPFALRRAGADKTFGTADDIVLALSAAQYNASKKTVTLKLAAPFQEKETLQLLVTASELLSTTGVPFDGDKDGKPGGNALVNVKV